MNFILLFLFSTFLSVYYLVAVLILFSLCSGIISQNYIKRKLSELQVKLSDSIQSIQTLFNSLSEPIHNTQTAEQIITQIQELISDRNSIETEIIRHIRLKLQSKHTRKNNFVFLFIIY